MSLSAAKPRVPDRTGIALDGRYELQALIGEGSFGRVYRGRDRRLARPVAIKLIKPWWAEDPHWVARFEREAQLMASVSDPQIVQIFDVGNAEEGLYYVAELVEGEGLDASLRRGAVGAGRALELAERVSSALGSAHARNVVHGDVKPANVLVTLTGAVKVTDFGLARLVEGSSGHAASIVAGSPTYMAPEQARGHGTTPASDVYSIGVMLYEMLAGRPPFQGDSPVEIAVRHLQDHHPPLPRSVPAPVAAVVYRALAKDPAGRYRDGAELAAALAQARYATRTSSPPRHVARRAAGSNQARPEGLERTLIAPWRGARRNVNPAARRRAIAAFGLVLLLLVAMIGGAIAGGGARVRVAELRGMTRSEVTSRLSRAHLHVKLQSRYSSAPSGTVIAQAPESGTSVSEGSTVLVTLSAGPAPVPVPGVVGFSSTDAQSSLRQLGLHAVLVPVPAAGVVTGAVTAQRPAAGVQLKPGAAVSLSIAEAPRWRSVLWFNNAGGKTSAPFQIRGTHWRIVYNMTYDGTCTFILVCSGPTANILSHGNGATLNAFDLSDGRDQVQTIGSGPGTYQVKITPGDDSAHWSAEVQDYY